MPAWFLDRRAGYRVFYRLVQSEDPETTELFAYLAMAFAKDKVLKTDMKKLRDAIKDGACTVSEWKPFPGSPRASHKKKELKFLRIFIFACIHNAGRSQMSAAFFNQIADTL